MSPKGRTLFGEQDPRESSLPRSEISSTSTHARSNPHRKHRTRPRPSRTDSHTTTSTKSSTRTRPRPRRKISYITRLRVAVESKLRLTIAFGFSVFASLIIYIALFVTKTSSGPIFHILSIVLLVSLGGIMIHSLVRFLALNSELKAHRLHRAGLKKTPSARGWNISRPLPKFTQSSTLDEKADAIGQADGGYENDEFPVFHAGAGATHYDRQQTQNPFDDTHDIEAHPHPYPPPLQHPPPTYGNTRTSIRLSINPTSPSPNHATHHNPSYNNNNITNITAPLPALVPGMPGWHPPSFRSEGGITAVLERRRREVEMRLGRGSARALKGGARQERERARQEDAPEMDADGYSYGGHSAGEGEEEVRGSGEMFLGQGRYQAGGGGMI